MTIYIEQVLVDNLTINSVLLVLVAKFLKLPYKKWRIFLASAIGTAFAFVFPLISIGGILLVLAKCALGLVIITIAFEYNSVKKCALIFFAFLLLTGLMGGVMLGLMFAFAPNKSLQNGTFVYEKTVPFGVYVLIAFVVAKIFLDMAKLSQKKQQLNQLKIELQIFFRQKVLPIKAFLDTGNFLTDPKSGQAVIVISPKVFCALLGISTLDFFCEKYDVETWLIPAGTLHKTSKIKVFRADKVVAFLGKNKKVFDNPILGLSASDFFASLDCDAIVGNWVCEGVGYD